MGNNHGQLSVIRRRFKVKGQEKSAIVSDKAEARFELNNPQNLRKNLVKRMEKA